MLKIAQYFKVSPMDVHALKPLAIKRAITILCFYIQYETI